MKCCNLGEIFQRSYRVPPGYSPVLAVVFASVCTRALASGVGTRAGLRDRHLASTVRAVTLNDAPGQLGF